MPKANATIARAALIAAIVGSALVLINHGDHILQEPVCAGFCWKAFASYLTPFLVSLVSANLAGRDRGRHTS